MKLQDIPMGGRFEYEGKVFVKTGPMSATSDQGGQRMIPRSAFLAPIAQTPDGLDKDAVLAAFDAFYLSCSRLVAESSRPELSAARQRFLAKVK